MQRQIQCSKAATYMKLHAAVAAIHLFIGLESKWVIKGNAPAMVNVTGTSPGMLER